MYHRYFGLQEEPFTIAVNPRYLFMSDRHRDALAHMLYGVGSGGGFVLLTGEVGTGKTTINRCLLEQLPADTDIAIVLNPALNAEELLATVCDELNIAYEPGQATLKQLTDRLHAFLVDNHQRGRRTVLLIDEAQHLQFDVLEQIRLLTNLETNTQKLLQIILVGQPELSEMLSRPELRQLNQRISARFELQLLNLPETQAYIQHRLQVAGDSSVQQIFPSKVVRAVYKRTGGVPRLINLLCDRMLLGCYGQNKSRVDMSMYRSAEAEVFGRSESSPASQPKTFGWAATVALMLVLISGLAWLAFQPEPVSQSVSPLPSAAPGNDEPAKVAEASPVVPSLSYSAALAQLAARSGVPAELLGAPCARLQDSGWQCLRLQADNWNEVLDYGQPALLSLVTAERFEAWLTLLQLDTESAMVIAASGETQEMPVAQLAELWSGEFTLLWRPPAAFSQPLSEGISDPLVTWLGEQFAVLDGQSVALATAEFNEALAQRVRLFQRQQGLDEDGVVGIKTLMRLQAVLAQQSGQD